MKNSLFLLALLSVLAVPAFSQEEGPAVARSRFDKPNTITIGGGLGMTFGKNVGDYSKGSSFEAGFLHRLNKVLSVGAYFSSVKFGYDPSKSPTSPAESDLYVGELNDLQVTSLSPVTYRQAFSVPADYVFRHGYQLFFSGGDLSLTTVGANLRMELIPFSEKFPVSVFVLARPFVAMASRKEVSGTARRYLYEAYVASGSGPNFGDGASIGGGSLVLNTNDGTWYPDAYTEDWGPQGGFDALKSKSNVTAGLQVGPGIEFRPVSSVTIYGQALFGYTLPVSFVSTASYPRTLDSYLNKSFPMVNKGFPSLGIQAGIGYNF